MKKAIAAIFFFTVVLISFTLSAGATSTPDVNSIEWSNTSLVIITHGYFDGEAECHVRIDGYSGAVIKNVYAKLEKIVGSSLVLIANWDNLSSSNNYFRLHDNVPGVEKYYTYRLSFTAEVVRNGETEYLDMYHDVYYIDILS